MNWLTLFNSKRKCFPFYLRSSISHHFWQFLQTKLVPVFSKQSEGFVESLYCPLLVRWQYPNHWQIAESLMLMNQQTNKQRIHFLGWKWTQKRDTVEKSTFCKQDKWLSEDEKLCLGPKHSQTSASCRLNSPTHHEIMKDGYTLLNVSFWDSGLVFIVSIYLSVYVSASLFVCLSQYLCTCDTTHIQTHKKWVKYISLQTGNTK